MRFGKPDDGGTVGRMYQREGKATPPDLFQDGLKYTKLSLREGDIRSVCVGKMCHQALDVKRIS